MSPEHSPSLMGGSAMLLLHRRITLLFTLLAVFAACSLGDGAAAQTVVFSGSTTVQSRILEPLAEDIRRATGVEIKVEGVGSGNGVKRLTAGEVAAAIVSSPLTSIIKAQNLPDDGTYIQHDLFEDIIVPIVHHQNPVTQLTWEQLSDLYSGKIKSWKEVGGADVKVQVVTSHPESATREVVWELVMGKKVDYARNARIVYATRKEMVMVAEALGAIGAVSEGFVRLYFDDARQAGDPVEIRTVDVKRISRPLAVVTKGPPSPSVAKVLAYLRTDEARARFR